METITREELLELVCYDAQTGIFTWRKKTRNGVAKGREAGCKSYKGYILIGVKGIKYQAHRLAWLYITGSWPENCIDHINHCRADNRWENLREATYQENSLNRSLCRTNASGVTGVFWHKIRSRWVAQIVLDEKLHYLGQFLDKFNAICARKAAEHRFGFHANHGK